MNSKLMQKIILKKCIKSTMPQREASLEKNWSYPISQTQELLEIEWKLW